MKQKSHVLLLFVLILSLFLAGSAKAQFVVEDIRCENLTNPVAIDSALPHFSWKLRSTTNGGAQTAYQILVARSPESLNENGADLWNSGKVASKETVFVSYAGKPLTANVQAYWKVRSWNGDTASAWSETARFGTGLIGDSGWKGEFMTLAEGIEKNRATMFRKKFDWKKSDARAVLHVNSFGYHEVWLNGSKVSEDVLSPGVSQLDKRSPINSHDLTELLKDGENDIVLWLARGWFNPGLSWCSSPTPGIRVQLEAIAPNGVQTVLASDSTWVCRGSEYSNDGTWTSEKFGGDTIDASKKLPDLSTASLDAVEWLPVRPIMIAADATPQMVQPNRIVGTFHPQNVKRLDDGKILVDMGKNLTGWLEIRFPPLKKGSEILMDYSDHLDEKGNVVPQPQQDKYIAAGTENEVFSNKFNYHGFRYAVLSNMPKAGDLGPANFIARQVRTGFASASSFECSDPDINAIHDMMQYTLQCLSMGGDFVDCPHYERLGYGGDGNSSLETAQTMYDLSPLYYHWLQAWEDVMDEDGSLPHIAPCPQNAGGGPYWCGFIITAAWSNYKSYGDDRALRKHYPAMKRWLSYVEKYSPDGLLKPWPVTPRRNWFLGDWATPKGVDQTLEATVDHVNNCFIVRCYDIMEKIAAYLDNPEDAKAFARKRDTLAQKVQATFFDKETNGYATESQIDLAFPMIVGITPESSAAAVRQRLFDVTAQKYDGHLACGLVGLPVLAEWSVKNRASDFLYSMLKKRTYPGFLYMIDHGATTTWEHWNAERSRIHNCYNALGPWFYQAVGGVRPDENEVAYRRFFVDPQPPRGIEWAKVSKETPYGTIRCDWTRKDGKMTVNLTVPVGCTAELALPDGTTGYKVDGQLFPGKNNVELTSGTFVIEYY